MHGDAVDDIGRAHGAAVVGDDDELRLGIELLHEGDVAVDVALIEGSVDLVEDAERAGLGFEDGEKEGHST